jgi:phenylacetate-CoA ligase
LKLDDLALDSVARDISDIQLSEAVRDQITFMRTVVPFWHERLSRASVDEATITSLADLARVPLLTKEEFRALRPQALMPKPVSCDIAMGRWTSGTSGRPTVSFWSQTDWAALVASTARMLARQAPMERPSAFNAYRQAHLTGPLYHAALSRLRSTVFDRSHHAEEVFPTSAQADLFDFDTLVIPSKAARGKSVGLQTLLDEDPSFLSRHSVRWWIGSSGTFDPETIVSARRQGVETVTNLYGSSEFGLFASSCPAAPGDYHIAQGHVLVEVVDGFGLQVDHGQFGRVVITHLRGMDGDGNGCRHQGTQVLRLANGDGATYLSSACSCGLTTARLRDIRRVATAN